MYRLLLPFLYRKDLCIGLLVLFSTAAVSPLSAQQFDYDFNQGRILYESNDPEGAAEAFRRSLEINPDQPEAWVYLVSALLQLERPDEAAEAVAEGLEYAPDNFRLLALRADALYRVKPESSIEAYNILVEALQQRRQRSANSRLTLSKARESLGLVWEEIAGIRYDNGDTEGALDALRAARRNNPGRISVHNNLAFILMEQQRYEESRTAIKRGLEQFPDHPDLLLMQANILSQTGDTASSVQTLQQLHESDPENVNIALAYGQALLFDNQAVKANEFFQEMLERHPDERRYYRTLIEINRQRMNLNGMHAVLYKMTERFPEDTELARELGESYLLLQEFEAAHNQFDSLAVEMDEAELAGRAAQALLFGEMWEQAASYYNTVLDIWPQHTGLKKDYALLLYDMNRREQAFKQLRSIDAGALNGRQLVHMINLSNDEQTRQYYAELASRTPHKPIAAWMSEYEIPDRSITSMEERESIFMLLNDIMELYGQKQSTVQTATEADLKRRSLSLPQPLHAASEFDEISNTLRRALTWLQDHAAYDIAEDIFTKLLAAWPESPLLRSEYAERLEENGNYAQALQELQKAIQSGASGAEIHMRMGHLYEMQDALQQAELAYERALTEDAEHAAAYRSLIRITGQQNNQSLKALCDRWMARYRQNRSNKMLEEFLIEALHKADRFDEARSIIERS
jgi:tetratricopeptide (TPR) repeat protein